MEILLKYITEFKTKCEFNGVDFEADLSTMYAETRRCMAVGFPEDFCPEIVKEPGKELKDMNSEEHEFYQKELVVSLGAKFNNRDSPRDKTLHVKGGYLLPLIEEGHPFSM